MSEMISFERMLVAGIGGLFVSCLSATVAGILILASALSGMGDSCRDGGCGSDGLTLVVALAGAAVLGVALSAGTIRVLLGRRGRGMMKLLVMAGGLLLTGTVILLAGSIVIGHAITGGAGALWLPLGLVAALVYLYFWTGAMTRVANRRSY